MNRSNFQLTELDAEYAKVSGTKPQTTRFLRSQQEKKKREQTEDGTEEEASKFILFLCCL